MNRGYTEDTTAPGYENGMPLPENDGVEVVPKREGPGRDADGNALPENIGVTVIPERKGPGQKQ